MFPNVERAALVAQTVKNLPANAGDVGLIPGLGRFPQRREWLPIPVFLPGEFHGQKTVNLAELGLGGGGK